MIKTFDREVPIAVHVIEEKLIALLEIQYKKSNSSDLHLRDIDPSFLFSDEFMPQCLYFLR